jgi:type I restriction enzyme M protein
MYALGASNMILRGDGKANLHQGSCFDEAITSEITKHQCNVGMLNPPYSQSDEDLHELVFVKHMLDCLTKGGVGLAIVPMSCAISPHPRRAELLKHHTLDAVMSMPTDLFYPVGTVPCIMIFRAHIPHKQSGQKTWFGYWKEDGFIKTKHKGRVDLYDRWPEIRDRWIEMYRNREDVPGESVKQYVSVKDEWCAEAYMQTDYSNLSGIDFKSNVLKYLSFALLQEDFATLREFINNKPKATDLANDREWKWYKLEDLFEIRKGKRLTKLNMTGGSTPFIGSIDNNNGYREFIGQKPIHDGNTITVNYNGSVAEAFYQPKPFWASDDVNVLYPRFKMNHFNALFLVSLIKMEKYRFNYGRKWHMERMASTEIKLPSVEGTPDFDYMEAFIKTLAYNDQL